MVHAKTAAAERLHRKRLSRAMRERWRDPTSRRAYRKALRKTARSPEGRAVRSAVAKAGWDDPVVHKRRVDALKRSWAEDHERRAASSRQGIRAAQQRLRSMTPDERVEYSRRLSEGQKAAWARRTPEQRAAMAAKVRQRWASKTAAERVAFGLRVSAGRARGGRPAAQRIHEIEEVEVVKYTPRRSSLNELARRIAAEAAVPADVALTVASVAMGVGSS